MKSKNTLQAVAALAKVSPATVSRLVNRTTRVSATVEARIRKAAAQLNFDLTGKRSNRLIAYLLANRSLLHPFHSQLLFAAEAH
jgi:DNA-binding LacI/PurR family transcriptional regulator